MSRASAAFQSRELMTVATSHYVQLIVLGPTPMAGMNSSIRASQQKKMCFFGRHVHGMLQNARKILYLREFVQSPSK